MKNHGVFISFEGPDGSGKTTQINLLKDYYEKTCSKEVIIIREPGGTRISEKLRNIVLDKELTEMDDMTELFLYMTARIQLVKEVIEPALNKCNIVICDRFIDSTAVYQGVGRGLGVDKVYELYNFALGSNMTPDITIMLNLDAEEGIKRKKNQTELDRIELADISFHQSVVQAYKELGERDKERIYSIDSKTNSTLSPQEIHEMIIKEIDNRLNNIFNFKI